MTVKLTLVYHRQIYLEKKRSLVFREDLGHFESPRGALLLIWKSWELCPQRHIFYV